jgi:hypothetical protein
VELLVRWRFLHAEIAGGHLRQFELRDKNLVGKDRTEFLFERDSIRIKSLYYGMVAEEVKYARKQEERAFGSDDFLLRKPGRQ